MMQFLNKTEEVLAFASISYCDGVLEMTMNKYINPYFKGQRKIVSGWRYFHCDECNYIWREACRDVESPSGSCCEKCHDHCDPEGWAYHPEWSVDKSGNLIDEII